MMPIIATRTAAIVSLIVFTAPALAQSGTDEGSVRAQRDTLRALMKPVSIEQEGVRLEDAIAFIEQVTGAEIEPIWSDQRDTGFGLDRDRLVRLKQPRGTGLSLIEKIAREINNTDDLGSGVTWQFTDGMFELGPRSELNNARRVVIYDVQDLMFQIAPIVNAPQFDLNSIFQQGGGQGGGGGQSPFQQQQNQNGFDTRPPEERIGELVDVIRETIEPEQWVALGGDAASITVFRQQLLINAPDYIHRQLGGYPWWPAGGQSSLRRVGGQPQRAFSTP